MIQRGTTFAMAVIGLVLLPAASPSAAAAPARLTPAQQARFKLLTEQLGECHRAKAVQLAGTKTEVDQIVIRTLAACEARVAPIRADLVKLAGPAQTDTIIAAQRAHWRDSIRRIVAAARSR